MISFFRKFRKSLVETGSTRKYIAYAIGEILLVMIGILLALQVNNWNEERKRTTLEHKILAEFAASITRDTVLISEDIRDMREIAKHADIVRNAIDRDIPYSAKMDTSLGKISTFNISESDFTVFENLKSLGVNLISNDSLRICIFKYYEDSKDLAHIERYFENGKYFRQQIYPKYFKKYRYDEISVPKNWDQLKVESEFLIALDYCINDAGFYTWRSRRRLRYAKVVLTIIENELSRNSIYFN